MNVVCVAQPPPVAEPPPKPIPLAGQEPLVLPSDARKKQAAMPPLELPNAAPPVAPQSITFKCRCGKSLKAAPEQAGKRARCPGCKEIVQVPMR